MLSGPEDYIATRFVGDLHATEVGPESAWQRRAWGLAIALTHEGHFNVEDLRQAWLSQPAHDDDGWSPCQRWLGALRDVADQAGLVDLGALDELGRWLEHARDAV